MKKVIFLLFILSLAVVSVNADDLTVKGKVYQDYEVTGYSEEGIIISHASGTATISPGDWPKDKEKDIAKFKVKIEKLKQQQIEKVNTAKAEAVKKANALPANAQCLIFKVISVDSGAVIGRINASGWFKNDSLTQENKIKSISMFPQYEKHLKEQDRPDNTLSPKWAKEENAVKKFTDEIDEQNTSKIICITGIDTEGITDEQQMVIAGIRSGTYKYVAVNGSTKTVPKFTAVKK